MTKKKEEMEKKKEEKKREITIKNNNSEKKISIQVTTPYISVIATSEGTDDNLDDVEKKVDNLLKRYKHHHLIGDYSEYQ